MQPNVKEGRLIDVDHEPRDEEGYDQADEEIAHVSSPKCRGSGESKAR
jgi:hypothetical protein